MSRINTNVSSLIARTALNNNNNQLNTSLERLSTGLKINSGKDNPAGLIASESLKGESAGITQAIDNAQRADNVISTAEGGLGEVSSLITQLQGLVNESANSGGLSGDETKANQLQVDSILSTINRIAGTTSFQGKKLLNGTLDYTTSAVASGTVNDLHINAAKLGSNSAITVDVKVLASATTAKVSYSGGTLTSAATLEIGGNAGVQQFSFGSGTTVSSIATAINAQADVTGVSATVSGTSLSISSQDFGSSQFVSVRAISGTFATDKARATGGDATVTVNGATATTDGKNVSFNSSAVDLSFTLDDKFNKSGDTSIKITGGGATFSLGSKVTYADQASIGIGAVTTGSLGTKDLGYLNSLGSGFDNDLSGKNLVTAQKIVDSAASQVATLRGRLGAFQKYTIGSTVNNLNVALENVSASQSQITDTDFASETANLTRAQILSQAAQSVLSQANSAPQAALRLLQ
ncbi:MAG: flagellin N-terminal helical domain-containing protein [Tepidisphaeraceae bacterium]